MPRKAKQYHYIYKTTCVITNKYYIGMHSAVKLNDGYLGSGKIIRRSIRKYGKDSHILEILEFCETREVLPKRESEIVNAELLKDPLCINLRLGGAGNAGGHMTTGWTMPPMTEEHRRNLTIARNKRAPYSEETKKQMSESHKKLIRTDEHKENNRLALIQSDKFQTKMKSDEHRQVMSQRTSEVHARRKSAGIPNKGGWCDHKPVKSDSL
jgi:hypothetical protein